MINVNEITPVIEFKMSFVCFGVVFIYVVVGVDVVCYCLILAVWRGYWLREGRLILLMLERPSRSNIDEIL